MKQDKKSGGTVQVPCSKCPECIARRTSAWSFRLMQQAKISSSAHFLTLTYDTKKVPITEKGFMSLSKRDVQLFFKRLRKSLSEVEKKSKITYYAVGEYGGKTFRPHYHILLFNAPVEKIQPAWDMGYVHYGNVTGASVGYTLKYMSKPRRIPMHQNDDRQKEFSLMSKGIGKNYLTEAMRKWHISDLENRMYCNIEDGKKISMPRYYKDKLYTDEQRKIVAAAHVQRMNEQYREFIHSPDYYQQLSDRNKAIEAAKNAMYISSLKNQKI